MQNIQEIIKNQGKTDKFSCILSKIGSVRCTGKVEELLQTEGALDVLTPEDLVELLKKYEVTSTSLS